MRLKINLPNFPSFGLKIQCKQLNIARANEGKLHWKTNMHTLYTARIEYLSIWTSESARIGAPVYAFPKTSEQGYAKWKNSTYKNVR